MSLVISLFFYMCEVAFPSEISLRISVTQFAFFYALFVGSF